MGSESSIEDRLDRWGSLPVAQRSGLRIVPLPIKQANVLVARWHRHHAPVHGALFALGVAQGPHLCGAAIVGRPVARRLHDGGTAEVVRLVTDGTPNACSILYAAAARAWFSLGGTRIVTYILAHEPGVSLRAAGWSKDGETTDQAGWSRPSRLRSGPWLGTKQRWHKLPHRVKRMKG
jgi:hypothetical protein